MLELLIQVLTLLFYVGCFVAACWVVLWFWRDVLHFPAPERAIQIFWGLVALAVIITLLTWLSRGGGLHLPNVN